jgi:3-oxoacyl-[acyl-carrier protein] reductase
MSFGDFSGYSVIVTGGSKGIGRGIAKVFLHAGADVMITGRDESFLLAASQELCDSSTASTLPLRLHIKAGKCSYFVGDVSSLESCQRMCQAALERHGAKLDVLVCNAGIYPGAALQDLTEQGIDLVMSTNLKGTVYSVQVSVKHVAYIYVHTYTHTLKRT